MSLPQVAFSIVRSLAKYRNFRQTVSELRSLDDRELADLGIGRSDITRLAREAVA
jgi:uncharacterized protein YjiS (DUF1127 family)